MNRIRPLKDMILVERRQVQPDQPIGSRIIIPDIAKGKHVEGVVVATGPGKRRKNGTRQPLDVQAGDRILFDKFVIHELKDRYELGLNGRDLILIQESDVVGVLPSGVRA